MGFFKGEFQKKEDIRCQRRRKLLRRPRKRKRSNLERGLRASQSFVGLKQASAICGGLVRCTQLLPLRSPFGITDDPPTDSCRFHWSAASATPVAAASGAS